MNQDDPTPVFRQLRALPNQLTLLRLSIVPFLVLAILEAHFHRAFVLMVVAGVSDGLDGALARLFRQRTELGSYLDPIADKLLLSTLFLVLMHVGLVSSRVTVMVFSRDVGIVIISALLYATTGTRDFHPSWLGKANTVAQIVAVCSVVLAQTHPAYWVLWTRHWSLLATLWLTVISGFHYLWRSGQRLGAPAEMPQGRSM
jgi:cardiolipin synthase